LCIEQIGGTVNIKINNESKLLLMEIPE